MRKNIKIIGIILFVIGSLMIFTSAILIITSKGQQLSNENKKNSEQSDIENTTKDDKETDKENTTKNDKQSDIENMVKNVYLSEKITKDDLKKYFDVDNTLYILMGKDSYLTYSLSDKLNSQEDLSKYEEKRKEYGKKIIDKYINNFKYSEKNDSSDSITIELELYNVGLYLDDLDMLSNKILENTNLDLQKLANDYEKYSINKYKAEVIAMQVLDKNIDKYKVVNQKYEYLKTNDKKSENYNLYNLIVNTNRNKTSSDEFIDGLYNQAVKDNKIDSKNPLKLLSN